MNKVLVICGLTATGKTSLGLHLAKKFNGEIVSADSRQVYRGLDIGTGKDLPPSSTLIIPNSKIKFGKMTKKQVLEIGYYLIDGIKLWGYDLMEPDQEFSVSQYLEFSNFIIQDIWKRGKLPIVVGGTGLYINGLLFGIDTASVPKNEDLRKYLENKNDSDLFDMLAKSDSIKAGVLNSSDKKNKRRLIRAVEVANWKLENGGKVPQNTEKLAADNLIIGLKADKQYINEVIKKRIQQRIDAGFQEEIERLIVSGISWEDQALNTLGYKQFKGYFYNGIQENYMSKPKDELNADMSFSKNKGDRKVVGGRHGKKSKAEVIAEWTISESRYAKRQLTWFKKLSNVFWFDIKSESWKDQVEHVTEKWYKNKSDR